MEQLVSKAGILSGTVLKWIAVISMTIDHIGYIFFPQEIWLRALGRLAFPIFAYMIAEGCYYTKNKKKYLGMIFAVGILCQAAMLIAANSWNLNALFTLGFSVVLIFLLQWARGSRDILGSGDSGLQKSGQTHRILPWVIIILVLACYVFLDYGMRGFFPDFKIDYGIFGITLGTVIYIMPKKYQKILVMALWLILMCIVRGSFRGVQWWSLFAVIPLLLYNGKPGKYRMKYFFYLYYPIHLGILWGIYFLR